jgi:enamine deaminase RidA (YjgF/YER057c/UK114 family)
MTRSLSVPLCLEYIPFSRLPQQDEDWHASVIGGAGYAHPPVAHDTLAWPLLSVDMHLPQAGEAMCEVWRCAEKLTAGQHGNIRYRQGDSLLFGCLSLDEPAATAGETRAPLQTITEAAYQQVFELLASLNFSAVLRFWNYFPAINQVSHDIERYRQFNIGRQDAFLAQGRSVIDNVPAACALGSASGGLQIAFLASREASVSIENPRQVSAYNYPNQYGPRSPSFSRAGLVSLAGQPMLFISGTASIVGHRSMHIGDATAQTQESLRNIASVVEQANRQTATSPFRLADLAYTIYVRHAADLPVVQREMVAFIGAVPHAVFLQADVCRADLLVEIEASGGHALADAQ